MNALLVIWHQYPKSSKCFELLKFQVLTLSLGVSGTQYLLSKSNFRTSIYTWPIVADFLDKKMSSCSEKFLALGLHEEALLELMGAWRSILR